MRSRVCEFAARLGNWATKIARGFNPFVDHHFGVRDGFGVRLAVSHTAWQFRHFDDEALVVFAPVNDQFVTRVHSMSILYLRSSSRTCFTWYGFAFPFRGCTFTISTTPSL